MSAEPETIDELEAGLKRFQKCESIPASSLHRKQRGPIDDKPWDAGILVIDLPARMVASESTYSLPTRKGKGDYHDGTQSTGFPLRYLLSDEWLFRRSIVNYQARCDERIKEREATPPLDTRSILYGEPLHAFLVENVQLLDTTTKRRRKQHREAVVDIHRRWLMTPRDELNGQSVREVLFAKRELIDFDLNSRMLQWSFFLEEPPSLLKESPAYRFAGYGTHEWVMYYDLVRFLIWEAVDLKTDLESHATHLMSSHCCRASAVITPYTQPTSVDALKFTPSPIKKPETASLPDNTKLSKAVHDGTASSFNKRREPTNVELIAYFAEQQAQWLSKPNQQLDGYIPAEIIDNERRRRPEAMTGRSMVVDENCFCCQMMGDESEAGLGIYFCHFDGCNMEDEFAFSVCATLEEWKAEQRRFEEWSRKSER
ncbi:MAG TPA: hypothetical protein VGQ39_06495, partial [Pyrinomonadaceae bacterium]|nr:hypothetical protein [Pyrinomonadaceae bacterium]